MPRTANKRLRNTRRERGESSRSAQEGQEGGQQSEGAQRTPSVRQNDPTFPHIEFATMLQYNRFQYFKQRGIMPTRYFDPATLRTLGIYDEMKALLLKCRLHRWIDLWYYSAEDLTYEFLSFLTVGNVNDVLTLFFRLRNEDRSITYNEFCDALSLDEEHPPAIFPDWTHPYYLYPKITSFLFVKDDPHNLTGVQHPVLKLFIKVLRCGFFAIGGKHLIRKNDLFVLVRALVTCEDTPISLPHLLWKQLQSLSSGQHKSTTKIAIGGHITAIAMSIGVPDPAPNPFPLDYMNDSLINMLHISSSRFLKPNLKEWIVNGHPSIPWPLRKLPPPTPDLPHYLLYGEPEVYLDEEDLYNPGGGEHRVAGAVPQRPRPSALVHPSGGASSSKAPFGAPAGFQESMLQIMAGINSLGSRFDTFQGHVTTRFDNLDNSVMLMNNQITSLEERFGGFGTGMDNLRSDVQSTRGGVELLQEDTRRALRPQYDFCYSLVDPDREPIPSWYQRPPYSKMYNVDLSRGLGGLQIASFEIGNLESPAGLYGSGIADQDEEDDDSDEDYDGGDKMDADDGDDDGDDDGHK